MATRPQRDQPGSPSTLAMLARVFMLSTEPPSHLFLCRADLDPGRAVGLPDGPIPLPALRDLVLSASVPQATRDAVWGELIRRSRADGPAWLVAAAGMALPGLRRQVTRLTARLAGERGDLEAAVVEGFLTELHRVDLTARGLCGRLVRAGYRAGLRQAYQDAPTERVSWPGFASQTPKPPWGHPDFVLAAAVRAGVVSRQDAWLIGVTRLEGVPIGQVAAELGELTNTVVARRCRAEHRLAAAIGAGDLSDDVHDRVTASDVTSGARATRRAATPRSSPRTSPRTSPRMRPGSWSAPRAGMSRRPVPGPRSDGVWAGVTVPAGHRRLIRGPFLGGDTDAVRVGSPVARGAGGSAGRGHAFPAPHQGPHQGKENGSPPPAPRVISPAISATPSGDAPDGGDLT